MPIENEDIPLFTIIHLTRLRDRANGYQPSEGERLLRAARLSEARLRRHTAPLKKTVKGFNWAEPYWFDIDMALPHWRREFPQIVESIEKLIDILETLHLDFAKERAELKSLRDANKRALAKVGQFEALVERARGSGQRADLSQAKHVFNDILKIHLALEALRKQVDKRTLDAISTVSMMVSSDKRSQRLLEILTGEP